MRQIFDIGEPVLDSLTRLRRLSTGLQIRWYRRAYPMSQSELARRAGYSTSHIRHIEAGYLCSSECLVSLCVSLGLDSSTIESVAASRVAAKALSHLNENRDNSDLDLVVSSNDALALLVVGVLASEDYPSILRKARTTSGVSQSGLAEGAAVSVGFIKKLESGARRPSARTHAMIINVLRKE